MHPKKQIRCEVCGRAAELEVVPDGADHVPASYTMRRTCSGGCPVTTRPLTPHEAQEVTGHTYDAETGRWTRLISTSVEGWIP